MEARLAVLADSLEVVIEKLTLFVAGSAEIIGVYRGCNSEDVQAGPDRRTIDTLEVTPAELIQTGDLNKLAEGWVAGGEPDWEISLRGAGTPADFFTHLSLCSRTVLVPRRRT